MRLQHPFSATIFYRVVALLILGFVLANDSGSVPRFITGSTAHLQKMAGNNRRVFSVVGDSISADAFFLKPISAGDYSLGQYGELGETIRYFGRETFAIQSAAVHIGWTSGAVLDPTLADWTICELGKSPLECEYRRTRPAAALIMLGSNDVAAGTALDDYRANLRRIVDISLDRGVIPILSTIPPMPALGADDTTVRAFNEIVRQMAIRDGLPLVDLWAALVDLPDQGISADGIHPNAPPDGRSTTFDDAHLAYGYTVRNLLSLQVLDELRRLVLE